MEKTSAAPQNPEVLRLAVQVELLARQGFKIGQACRKLGLSRASFYVYRPSAIEEINNKGLEADTSGLLSPTDAGVSTEANIPAPSRPGGSAQPEGA